MTTHSTTTEMPISRDPNRQHLDPSDAARPPSARSNLSRSPLRECGSNSGHVRRDSFRLKTLNASNIPSSPDRLQRNGPSRSPVRHMRFRSIAAPIPREGSLDSLTYEKMPTATDDLTIGTSRHAHRASITDRRGLVHSPDKSESRPASRVSDRARSERSTSNGSQGEDADKHNQRAVVAAAAAAADHQLALDNDVDRQLLLELAKRQRIVSELQEALRTAQADLEDCRRRLQGQSSPLRPAASGYLNRAPRQDDPLTRLAAEGISAFSAIYKDLRSATIGTDAVV